MDFVRTLKALRVWLFIPGLVAGLALAGPRAAAQTILTGTVRNAAGQPLEGILLEAETKAQPPATAFVISAADGSFKLTLDAKPASDSVYLSARALGYAAQRLRLANRSQAVPLTMQAGATQLKEVTVRGAPITRHSDTLNYKVDAFATKQDRVISDVLKKMPGIEVAGNGQISYQGKPINKFYINGQDLLEGRYTLASDNLPAGAVQSVQVLERHQPIRALDSLERPDQAAINLQLKNKVTATGQARLGAGVVPAPLAPLWNVNLSPMLFAGRQQLIDTYQTNNTGQDASTALNSLAPPSARTSAELSNQPPDLTHVLALGRPSVAASRYLFNQVHLLSANHLVTISPENQLRVNASYLHDAQTQRGGAQTRFFLPDGRTVALTENRVNRATLSHLLTDLAFIKNVKRYYLKNTLSLDARWDSQTGDLYRAESQSTIQQRARTPFGGLTNRLELVRPIGGRRIVQAASLVFFNNSPQELVVRPGPFAGLLAGGVAYDSARQQARLGSFYTSNSAGLTGALGNWSYSGTAGFTQEAQQLATRLETSAEAGPTPAALPLRNDLAWRRGRYYLEPGLSRQNEQWDLDLRMPVSYYDFQATDAPLAAGQRLRTVVAEPTFSTGRKLNAHWRVSADAGLRNDFGRIEQLSYAYILRDYRSLQRNAAPLPRTQTQHYAGSLSFTDPLNSRFGYANYSFSNARSNRLYSSQVDANGALTTLALDQETHTLAHSLNASLSQFISPWKTNLTLLAVGNYQQQPQLLNGQLVQAETRSATASLKASVAAFDWGSLDYQAALTSLRTRLADLPASPAALVQEHHATLGVYPGEHHQFLLAADYYDSRGPAPAVRATFADLTYRYQLPTRRKLDVEIRWTNIFDTRRYQYSYVSAFQLTQTTYELRPAQVLASLRLSL